MSDLEEKGYLDHPYTSAGRVPTDLGYRTFVDELMSSVPVGSEVRDKLRTLLQPQERDAEELLRISTDLLGDLTHLLGVVLSPRLSNGVLERLEIVPLSSTRVMFILSVRGGLIRTMIFHMESGSELRRNELARIVMLLNERLAGLTLEEIRKTCLPRVRDLGDERTGIVRLILNESAALFSEIQEERKVAYRGTPNIIGLPEFQDPSELKGLIELLEDDEAMFYLLEEPDPIGDEPVGCASVRIGRENLRERLRMDTVGRYSIVKARYQIGDTVGTIGVIGPTRMDYPKVVTLIEEVARHMSRPASEA